jgi:hypothetical protein
MVIADRGFAGRAVRHLLLNETATIRFDLEHQRQSDIWRAPDSLLQGVRWYGGKYNR